MPLEYWIKISLTFVLASIVGFEREERNNPAGLRTHILTAVAACLLILLSKEALAYFSDASQINADPFRLFEAVVVGVSFIGGGAILKKESGKPEAFNLSTAASVLVTAIVGIAVGIGEYFLAIVVTLLVALVNRLIGWWERQYLNA